MLLLFRSFADQNALRASGTMGVSQVASVKELYLSYSIFVW